MRFKHHPLALALVVFLAVMFPEKGAYRIRSLTLSSVIPVWHGIDTASTFLFAKLFAFRFEEEHEVTRRRDEKVEELQLENGALLRQLEGVKEWLLAEERLDKEIEQLAYLQDKRTEDSFFERRTLSMIHRLDSELHALPAKVIFREPATWTEKVWIDVGDEDNGNLAVPVVQKNSPILVGDGLVGIIEKVEKKRSLVRLVTDPGMNIAVRVIRGREQDRLIYEATGHLIHLLRHRPEFREKARDLELFRDRLELEEKDVYLAKGILHGCTLSVGRSHSPYLRGEGFNYDYPDDEGPARDLRTGEPFSKAAPTKALSLIEPGDLLITSGLDALFPEGFRVGVAENVDSLSEGAVAYSIRARSVVKSLNRIKHVIVVPPLRGME